MRPQLLITICLLWQTCSLKAQSLNYMPPTPGGFEVLVGGRYMPTTDRLYLGNYGVDHWAPTTILQAEIQGQYALGTKPWVFAATIPAYQRIKQSFDFGNAPVQIDARGFGNVELALRYLMRKPELIGRKTFFLVESRLILPPSAHVHGQMKYQLGYYGLSYESGLFYGMETENWLVETGFQLGLRANYSDYYTAYGKLERQLNSWHVSLALNARNAMKKESIPNIDNIVGFIYSSEQYYLIGTTELKWNSSRFLGYGVSCSRVLLGRIYLAYTAIGGSVYVRWN